MADMQKIEAGYKAYHTLYDDALSSRGFFMKLYNQILWGIDDKDYTEKLLSYIPDTFSGKLLDVPVGTGIHTYHKYAKLQDASITALDYSDDMLRLARQRMQQQKHISFVQGDVGALPFASEYFDTVLSMNGFHAFPDKEAAFTQTHRVLKKNGIFIGCFYITEERSITDFAVRSLYVKKGWFTPPFFTLQSLQKQLESQYREVQLNHVKSIAYFRCVK